MPNHRIDIPTAIKENALEYQTEANGLKNNLICWKSCWPLSRIVSRFFVMRVVINVRLGLLRMASLYNLTKSK